MCDKHEKAVRRCLRYWGGVERAVLAVRVVSTKVMAWVERKLQ